ncbi:hypothetical protein ILYODFUR_017287 [Ilyodon furcidens]|uniref:Uncharacterized protein n=1 Tax=Ilyodon furcidens TaxID=33524 RepID=A0ABV0VER6_9TELE
MQCGKYFAAGIQPYQVIAALQSDMLHVNIKGRSMLRKKGSLSEHLPEALVSQASHNCFHHVSCVQLGATEEKKGGRAGPQDVIIPHVGICKKTTRDAALDSWPLVPLV